MISSSDILKASILIVDDQDAIPPLSDATRGQEPSARGHTHGKIAWQAVWRWGGPRMPRLMAVKSRDY